MQLKKLVLVICRRQMNKEEIMAEVIKLNEKEHWIGKTLKNEGLSGVIKKLKFHSEVTIDGVTGKFNSVSGDYVVLQSGPGNGVVTIISLSDSSVVTYNTCDIRSKEN
jgi:hypothetical protein